MACHLAGVTTAVATCGTAFGVDHVKIIRRVMGDVDNRDSTGTGEVIFTFDPDEAGQKAASRAFAEEQRFAAQTFVAVAPDGLDPCDLRLKKGDAAVKNLIKTRKPMFEFMVRRVLDTHNLETVEGRVAALREAAPVVASIRDQALAIGYRRNLAGWLGMDVDEVTRAVRSVGQAPRAEEQKEQPSGPTLTQLATDPSTRLERDVIMAVLQHPTDVGREMIERIAGIRFGDEALSVVRDAIATSVDHLESPTWLAQIVAEVPAHYSMLVQQLGMAPIPAREGAMAAYCTSVAVAIVDRDLLRRKKELVGALQRTDSAADATKYQDLQKELVAIETSRRLIRED
jgi:DNA primase